MFPPVDLLKVCASMCHLALKKLRQIVVKITSSGAGASGQKRPFLPRRFCQGVYVRCAGKSGRSLVLRYGGSGVAP